MPGGLIEKKFAWDLQSPPDALWPLLSDTPRLNEALDLPLYRIAETIDRDGQRRRYGEMDEGGSRVRWEELPYEWVEGQWWRWRRFYESGPLYETGGVLALLPRGGGGTRVTYTLTVEPNGTLGKLLVASGYLKSAAQAMKALSQRIDAHCRKPAGDFFSNRAAEQTPNAAAKPIPCVTEADADRALLAQLASWLAVAPLADVMSLRTRRLARALGVGPSEALRACQLGAEGGALIRRYRAICPSCRASAHEYDALSKVPPLMSCLRCGAGYRRDLAGNVEALFSATPEYRTDPGGAHCASGPSVTPFAAFQKRVAPLERCEIEITPERGYYILRVADGPVSEPFEVNGPMSLHVFVEDEAMTVKNGGDGIACENGGMFPVTIALEHCAWEDDALPVADMIADPAYQDFAQRHGLSEGDSAPCGDGAMIAVTLPNGIGGRRFERFGAVCPAEGDAALLLVRDASQAWQVAQALRTEYPDAAIGLDCGALTLATVGGISGYVGTVPETALTLCAEAEFGEIRASAQMGAAPPGLVLQRPDDGPEQRASGGL